MENYIGVLRSINNQLLLFSLAEDDNLPNEAILYIRFGFVRLITYVIGFHTSSLK